METSPGSALEFYQYRLPLLVEMFNRPFPLPYYFGTMISRRCEEIKIADIGCGPICKIGGVWDDKRVEIIPSDLIQPDYQQMIDELGVKLIWPTEYQDMECLTYPDESFDIVHCVNAMDHTEDAWGAIQEAVRICRPHGHIYLRHAVAQKRRWGGHHFWNVNPDGSFSNGRNRFGLDGFRSCCDGHHVVSIMRKKA